MVDTSRVHASFRRGLRAWLVALLALPSPSADSSYTRAREVAQLAPGVYAIRHEDPLPGWVNGNTLVVIGTSEVLVVDACNVAWEAQADIAQIRQWTALPVRTLVNTHWHHDHSAGNRAYLEAFPGLTILAHAETKRRLDATAPFVTEQILGSTTATRATLEGQLASGKESDGRPLSDERRARVQTELARVAEVEADARAFVYQAPTRTFEDRVTVDLGGREVQVAFLGRGNTGGDAIAYLPAERILATGDLVVYPVPYTFSGYPSEWVGTLERLARLDAATIVPGHGAVLHDERYLLDLHDLFEAIVEQVGGQLDRAPGLSLQAVRSGVEVRELRDALLEHVEDGPAFLDSAVAAFVELAYHEAKLR